MNEFNNENQPLFQEDEPRYVQIEYQDRFGNTQTDFRKEGDFNLPADSGGQYTATNGDEGTALNGRYFS